MTRDPDASPAADLPAPAPSDPATLLDQLFAWHLQLAEALLTGRPLPEPLTQLPPALTAWLDQAVTLPTGGQPLFDRLRLRAQTARTALTRLSLPPKPEVLTTLQEALSGLAQDLRRLDRAQRAAEARLDPLTGLRSRAGMLEDLDRERNRSARARKPWCLALLDVDRFKSVNDTYGHDAGDAVLVAVAGVIDRHIRSFDDAWRLGGEEFLLALKDVHLAQALGVVDRLRRMLRDTPIPIATGSSISVTASFGVVEMREDLPLDRALQEADQAMYRAKQAGRDRVAAAELILAD